MRPRSFATVVGSLWLAACGFPRPDEVGGRSDAAAIDAPASGATLTSFGFTQLDNPALLHDLVATIHDHQVDIYGFLTVVANLTPTFVVQDGDAFVGDAPQTDHASPHDFTSPVIYHLVGHDGSTQNYQVSFHVRALKPGSLPVTAPRRIAAGDLDHDGFDDFVVSRTDKLISVYRGSTGGPSQTAPISITSVPDVVALVDLDGDGRDDLAFGDATSGVSTVSNQVSGFGPAVPLDRGVGVISLATGDLDRNGHRDVAVAIGGSADKLTLLLNIAQAPDTIQLGNPQDITATAALHAVATLDADGDGVLDLAMVTGNNTRILLSTTNMPPKSALSGEFTWEMDNAVVTGPASQLVVGDFDGDQKQDLIALTANSTSAVVLRGLGGQIPNTSTVPIQGPGTALAFACPIDLDRDGHTDLAVVQTRSTGSMLDVYYYVSATPFGFAKVTSATFPGGSPLGCAVGDFDGNGAQDVVVLGTSVLELLQTIETN